MIVGRRKREDKAAIPPRGPYAPISHRNMLADPVSRPGVAVQRSGTTYLLRGARASLCNFISCDVGEHSRVSPRGHRVSRGADEPGCEARGGMCAVAGLLCGVRGFRWRTHGRACGGVDWWCRPRGSSCEAPGLSYATP